MHDALVECKFDYHAHLSPKKLKKSQMKRERAVWQDEEDLAISSRPRVTRSLGSKSKDLDYHGSLRAEFQYVFIIVCFHI